jgi:hypothetical protein
LPTNAGHASSRARTTSSRALVLACLAVLATACLQPRSDAEGATFSTAPEEVIYGTDDRVDVFEVEDASLRALAMERVGALVLQNRLANAGRDAVEWRAPSLAERSHVCATERFAGQPSLANCSAVLIDDDLMLTAGHCLGSRETMSTVCRDTAVLFGFAYGSGPYAEATATSAVYACKRVLAFSFDKDERDVADYAVLLLERPATLPARRPARIAPRGAIGHAVYLIGNGAGLPTKIDRGGAIVDALPSQDFFSATTDSFSGGSGSGIFDESHGLIGIQSRGQGDWLVSLTDDCSVAKIATTGFERHQFADRAVDALCASGWPSERLCGAKPVCGDGACASDELTTCPQDCAGSPCGDGVCTLAKRRSCPSDCAWLTAIPSGWTCPPRDYRDGTLCHCRCGAPDPDCGAADASTIGCDWGQTCSEEGICERGRSAPPSASSAREQCGIARVASTGSSVTTEWALVLIAGLARRRRRGRGRVAPARNTERPQHPCCGPPLSQ